ncbi:MAG: hypothetical protein LBC09_04865, partial [Helicobacteraceae bacterium]|nr:hypothetical protein [Helicobacteraceae bacterium]
TFSDYESKTKDFTLPKFIKRFLEPVFSEALGKTLKPDAARIKPVLDDRMFAVCHYKNDRFSEELKNGGFKTSENWYKFVFVDNVNGSGLSCQNQDMLGGLIGETTYTRWSDLGTLYGVSRYSFVCVSNNENFGRNVISAHFKTMYRELALIWLMNRATILAFSEEAAHISRHIEKYSDSANKINGLYGQYIRFINRFYFREVSPQEQGIELHDLAIKNMRINEQLKALDEEIEELNAYTSAAKMERLTTLGACLLPPSLVVGFFGVNTFAWEHYIDATWGWIVTSVVIIFGFALACITTKWALGRCPRSKRSSNKYKEKA